MTDVRFPFCERSLHHELPIFFLPFNCLPRTQAYAQPKPTKGLPPVWDFHCLPSPTQRGRSFAGERLITQWYKTSRGLLMTNNCDHMIGFTFLNSLNHHFTIINQPWYIIGLGLILWLLSTIIYAYVLSPIRHLPGPFLSSLSSAPMWYNAIKSQRAKWVHSLHKKYGPVVRVAPNYVSVSDPSSIKQIYGGSSSNQRSTMRLLLEASGIAY